MESKREFPRHPVSLWAVRREGEARFYCHVRDLSLGGLFFESKLPYPVGTALEFELDIPGRDLPLHTLGTTVHTGGGNRQGNGVHFRELSAEDRACLQQFLSPRN